MIAYDARNFVSLRNRLRREATFIPFLTWFITQILPPIQDAHFSGPGASGGKSLASQTVRLRARRVGYYEQRPMRGVSATGPFGKWTGNTMRHTFGPAARITIRQYVATVQHSLKRWWVVNWWDMKALERHAKALLPLWFQIVFEGKRPPSARRAA